MFDWFNDIINTGGSPQDEAAPETTETTETTETAETSDTAGTSRPAVGEAVEDPRTDSTVDGSGFEQVYSSTFSHGATEWFSYFPPPPVPAVLAPNRDDLFRPTPRYSYYPLSVLRCLQPSSIEGDTWPRNRIPALPPPPPQPPLSFVRYRSPANSYPEYPRPQLRSSFAQPPNLTPRGTTIAMSTHDPSNTVAPELLSSSYSHGLAIARSGGHGGIIEPLPPLNPPTPRRARSVFAPGPSTDPLSPTVPEPTLTKSPQEESWASVERGRRRKRQPRRQTR
ncbi:hypothetical protein GQX73_g4577 [Xylaria multiplex]|uniref:Uncharacterized protein n=1 Tax=Xylaria multiplex TaxID=323545 RepID=A0A7C8MQM2_9PEZI|nr:hypothetical protein GQX73_g4577 [Xylaria multiplex]